MGTGSRSCTTSRPTRASSPTSRPTAPALVPGGRRSASGCPPPGTRSSAGDGATARAGTARGRARRSQYRPRERAARGAGPGPAAPLAWLRVERPGRVLDGPAGLPRVLCGGRGAAAAGGLALAPGRAPPAPAGPVPGGVLLLPPAGGLHLQPPLERAA